MSETPDRPTEAPAQPMDASVRAQLEESFARFTRERYARPMAHSGGGAAPARSDTATPGLDLASAQSASAARGADSKPPESSDSCVRRWAEIADLGWLALGLPEAYGGTGASIRDLVPLLIAAAQGLWREPLLQTLGDTCDVLLAAPACDARDRILSGVVSGERRVAFVRSEPNARCSAEPRPGDVRGHVVQGRALLAVSPAWFTDVIVAARIRASNSGQTPVAMGKRDGSAPALSLFAVARGAPGVRIVGFRTVDRRDVAMVDFNHTPAFLVSTLDSLGHPCERSVILAAAEAVGSMRAVIAATISHMSSRKQFGQTLVHFQALRHRLVEMEILHDESTAHLWAVARSYDERTADLPERILRLRVQVARAARWVTQQGIQLHGAMGMTDELPIGDYYKRALALESGYLQPDAALDALADNHEPLGRR